jgi:predicted GH43/DUF377 family glycosyl hydrolase
MKWRKMGLIIEPDKSKWWGQKYCIYPTPLFIEKSGVIRIYFASTDNDNFGRISFVDVDPANPSRIISRNDKVILDTGKEGTFDCCGVSPSCITEVGNKMLLYYNGFERTSITPYHIYSGVAEIQGDALIRLKSAPVLDRKEDEYIIRAGQTIVKENDVLRTWYVSAYGWEKMNTNIFHDKYMPLYGIKYAESTDGINWTASDQFCIRSNNDQEFGFGRPWVIKENDRYKIWYSIRERNRPYRIGYAESVDGKNWIRKDKEAGIEASETGWDSEMICYASVIKVNSKTYMFYNGNNNGATGFGYAELMENG